MRAVVIQSYLLPISVDTSHNEKQEYGVRYMHSPALSLGSRRLHRILGGGRVAYDDARGNHKQSHLRRNCLPSSILIHYRPHDKNIDGPVIHEVVLPSPFPRGIRDSTTLVVKQRNVAMLVFTRKLNEGFTILVGDDKIEINIFEIRGRGKRVKIGVEGPSHAVIYRNEILKRIHLEEEDVRQGEKEEVRFERGRGDATSNGRDSS